MPRRRGGTGKTQLAVGFAHTMWSARAVDLLVWVAAGNRTAIIAGYARAAADLDLLTERDEARDRHRGQRRAAVPRLAAHGPSAAGRSCSTAWSPPPTSTGCGRRDRPGRSWSPAGCAKPELGRGPGRRRDRATPSPGSAGGRRSATSTRGSPASPTSGSRRSTWPRTSAGCRSRSPRPAAVITWPTGRPAGSTGPSTRSGCATTADTADRRLPASRCSPPGRSRSSTRTSCRRPGCPGRPSCSPPCFDTSGIPAAVLTSPAACAYIAGSQCRPVPADDRADPGRAGRPRRAEPGADRLREPGPARPAERGQRQRGAHGLAAPDGPVRVRAYLAAGQRRAGRDGGGGRAARGVARAGAPGHGPQLSQALRDCAAALRAFAGDLLWKPEAHPVLLRAGTSLTEPPGARGRRHRVLAGARHREQPAARATVTRSRCSPGTGSPTPTPSPGGSPRRCPSSRRRSPTARRPSGPQHPDTVTARLNVARSLRAAGREPEAIALYEQVLAARERMFGPGHRETLAVRAQLADVLRGGRAAR